MKKGRVFSNLAVSLDGKIADRRVERKLLGTSYDFKLMLKLRKEADVILVGAKTLMAHSKPMRAPGVKKQPVNAVVTASGRLDPDMPFWDSAETIRFVFTTTKGLAAAQRAARDRAFVIAAGEDRVDLKLVFERFRESQLSNVLVEGGGELMADCLEGGFIDELYVTLTPWLLGGRDNPSLVGGIGLSKWKALRLKSSKKVGDEIYLRYQVKKGR